MALTFIPTTGTNTTPGGGAGWGAWTDVATCTVSSDCSFMVDDIFLIGKGPSGETATYKGAHRGKRVSGTTTLIQSIYMILPFSAGSDTTVNSCTAQLVVSGTNLILQVKAPTSIAVNMTWYGGFTLIKF